MQFANERSLSEITHAKIQFPCLVSPVQREFIWWSGMENLMEKGPPVDFIMFCAHSLNLDLALETVGKQEYFKDCD